LAKVKGQKGNPDFTDNEKGNGFKQVWLPFKEALDALEKSNTTNFEGSAYIVPRDTAFLEEARALLK
jgi:hypothetical protein